MPPTLCATQLATSELIGNPTGEMAMTQELRWLCYTAMLAASLWIPYIVGINVADFEGKKELFVRPPDPSQMKPWVHRSLRAHQNLLEQLLPFSVVVPGQV